MCIRDSKNAAELRERYPSGRSGAESWTPLAARRWAKTHALAPSTSSCLANSGGRLATSWSSSPSWSACSSPSAAPVGAG
eukprot:13246069-Alexandrium_andersonii.AAC.1